MFVFVLAAAIRLRRKFARIWASQEFSLRLIACDADLRCKTRLPLRWPLWHRTHRDHGLHNNRAVHAQQEVEQTQINIGSKRESAHCPSSSRYRTSLDGRKRAFKNGHARVLKRERFKNASVSKKCRRLL